jgi:peroxiredoxin
MRQRPDSHLCTGKEAPDFRVIDADEQWFKLSEELKSGPIVLVFYPADFGVVCSIEMREFKEAKEEFDLRGYRVVWINTDSIRSHRGWRAKMKVPFRMLSDASGKASKLFGVFIENENGLLKRFSNRAIFVIQEDGCITYKWVADQPAVSPDLEQVIASLDRKTDVNR